MFNKLIGNNHIKETLRRMLATDRVPHSLLFAGVEGIGKKQFALELAKSFVCQNPKNFEACDICAACKRADKFTFPKPDDKDAHKEVIFSEHADIGLVIPYNKNILIDAVRNLEKEANFRPFEAKARFLLIDEAEKLNTAKDNAANALLKTLEEPPPTSYIFLITSRPDALLPTILSRCQTLRFAPIAPTEIENYLLETKKFSPDDAAILARLSRGSIGHALSMDLSRFPAQRDVMSKVLESLLIKQNRTTLLRTAEEMNDAKNKDSYNASLEILETLIHDIWKLTLGNSEENIVNADIKNNLKKLAENADSKRLASWLTEIETMRENFNVNLNKKIATDALFMQMANGF
ncbi:MAG: DNA polymerase III subunit delta' [Acidobacteria bacterium]|nr:DNA polymerase III subunit delta' [Acidobacteriota bacterium]